MKRIDKKESGVLEEALNEINKNGTKWMIIITSCSRVDICDC